jgi:hypothetical protein
MPRVTDVTFFIIDEMVWFVMMLLWEILCRKEFGILTAITPPLPLTNFLLAVYLRNVRGL